MLGINMIINTIITTILSTCFHCDMIIMTTIIMDITITMSPTLQDTWWWHCCPSWQPLVHLLARSQPEQSRRHQDLFYHAAVSYDDVDDKVGGEEGNHPGWQEDVDPVRDRDGQVAVGLDLTIVLTTVVHLLRFFLIWSEFPPTIAICHLKLADDYCLWSSSSSPSSSKRKRPGWPNDVSRALARPKPWREILSKGNTVPASQPCSVSSHWIVCTICSGFIPLPKSERRKTLH